MSATIRDVTRLMVELHSGDLFPREVMRHAILFDPNCMIGGPDRFEIAVRTAIARIRMHETNTRVDS